MQGGATLGYWVGSLLVGAFGYGVGELLVGALGYWVGLLLVGVLGCLTISPLEAGWDFSRLVPLDIG